MRTAKHFVEHSSFSRIMAVTVALLAMGLIAVSSSRAQDRPGIETQGHSATAAIRARFQQKTDDGWTVVDVRGDVLSRQDESRAWRPVFRSNVIGPGVTLKTRYDGRVTLMRGEDVAMVGADTHMSLPERPTKGITRVLQKLGSILFKVDKKPGRQFKVETPHLIAGVKGTTFSVHVTNDNAMVSVTEGTVGVSTQDGEDDKDVTAGQTAKVSAGDTRVDVMDSARRAGAARGATGSRRGVATRNETAEDFGANSQDNDDSDESSSDDGGDDGGDGSDDGSGDGGGSGDDGSSDDGSSDDGSSDDGSGDDGSGGGSDDSEDRRSGDDDDDDDDDDD